jgi:hypothetical protein
MYRLAALPAAFTCLDDVLVEDQHGRLFVLERDIASLMPVKAQDEGLIMSFFEASQDTTWRTEADMIRIFCRNATADQVTAATVLPPEDFHATAP